jgi:predicted TIM-barrel fold metal-dependent hydrolase
LFSPSDRAFFRRALAIWQVVDDRRERYMTARVVGCTAMLLVAWTGPARLQVATALVPLVDHHQHLLSPMLAAALSELPPPAVELPRELHQRFREGLPRFNDVAALAELYTEDAVLIFSFAPQGPAPETWVRGRQRIASFLSGAFRNQYSITPVSYGVNSSSGHIAGYLSGIPRHYAVLLSLMKEGDGAWRIAAQSMTFGSSTAGPVTADRLIAQLDAAGIQRAAVLSLAYAHGSPGLRGDDEYAQVRGENDWTSQQVARYPNRLRAFCSFNPLREYALTELDRCAKDPNLRHGLKLHFANSGVDLRNAAHVEQLRLVFRAANERRIPIVAHIWTGAGYGRAEAQIVLNEVIPAAPDVPIQLAHLTGAGPGLAPGPQEALAMFADAVSSADPRTRNLYFDVTTNVTIQTSAEEASLIAARLRQIGLQRILYGSDMAIGGNPTARQSWGAFRAMLPLTEKEFGAIAGNVAPYMR